MTYILNLETSTTVCSVSVTGDEKILSLREIADAKSHASLLIPFITEALDEAGIKTHDLSAIAVSKGPGSYTGLRIGVSTAKGLAYALNVPLISVDTLYSMASGFLSRFPEIARDPEALFCPMIDARRMEVYTSVYNADLQELRPIKAEIINQDSFGDLLKEQRVHFFGDGALKCKETIHSASAFFHSEFHPSASFMGKIAFTHFKNSQFENLAYFEPFYLKDFVTTVPVNKLTGF